MPVADLKDKTVMIMDGGMSDSLLGSLKDSLQRRGASVVVGSHSPQSTDNIDLLCQEVKEHEPKVDAVIIHHTDLGRRESLLSAVGLVGKLAASLPVMVSDAHDNVVDTQRIEAAGAKYFTFDASDDQIAFTIADAIAKRGKPGRTPAGV